MIPEHSHSNYPRLHTTVGIPQMQGIDSPPIELETFLDLTTLAESDGIRFDGVDLPLHDSYLSLEAQDLEIKALASDVRDRELVIGTLIAPLLSTDSGEEAFLNRVKNCCRIGRRLRNLGARPYGVIRIDSGHDPITWAEDAFAAQRRMVERMQVACAIAGEFGERLAMSGLACRNGLQDWRSLLDILERVNQTDTLGLHLDLAEMLFLVQAKANTNRALLENWDGKDSRTLDVAIRTLAEPLRRWTISLYVSQSDGSSIEHRLLPSDQTGKLQLTHHIGSWLYGDDGRLTKALQHLCWDGGSFPAQLLLNQETWDGVLASMIAIRDAHGWKDTAPRKRIDPAEAIVRAKKAERAQKLSQRIQSAPRRQTTLRVTLNKTRNTAQTKKRIPTKTKTSSGGDPKATRRSKATQRKSILPSQTTTRVTPKAKDRAKLARRTAPMQATRRPPDSEIKKTKTGMPSRRRNR